MPNPLQKALPWATAAGAVVLVAGTIAGATGAGAASHAAMTPAQVMNALGVPAAAAAPASPVAATATGQSIVSPAAHAKATNGVGVTKAVKATKAVKSSTPAVGAAKSKYTFFDSGYILRLRAASIEVEPDIPHPLVPGVGYSAVNLEKDIGGPDGGCEIYGAGAYFTDVVQEGVLENSGPPDAGNKGGGIFNPTEAKDTKPNLSPGANLNARKPQVRDVTDGHDIYDIPSNGNGVRWEAGCDSDVAGKGIGNNVDVAGIQAIGSNTQGAIDKTNGTYTGTSRVFAAGIQTASGSLDFVSSIAQITALPGKEATVTYRISAAGGDLVSGANIPLSDVTKQFNDAVAGQKDALSSLGELGVTLLGPTVTESENGHRPIINMPFFDVTLGLASREGQVGQNQHVRLCNIDFEGQYTQ